LKPTVLPIVKGKKTTIEKMKKNQQVARILIRRKIRHKALQSSSSDIRTEYNERRIFEVSLSKPYQQAQPQQQYFLLSAMMRRNNTTTTSSSWIIAILAIVSFFNFSCHGFTSTTSENFRSIRSGMTADSSRPYGYSSMMSTVIDAPTKEDVDRKTRRKSDDDDFLGDQEDNFEDAVRKQGPLEWLEDDMEVSRDMEDPFHILLLGQTFEKPKITVPYVASSLEYVLDMPVDEALELSQFSHDHGMSCLGVWPREECLRLGRQLQVRDIVCRVVPFVEGGQRGWQAKDSGGVSQNSERSLK
jgi:hypothetical protein